MVEPNSNFVKIYLILSTILSINSCNNYGGEDINTHLRYQLMGEITSLATRIEIQRCNDKSYPNWSTDEFYSRTIENDIDADYYKSCLICEIDYKSSGQKASLYIISNYICKACKKRTVVKISNGKIYWKDDVAGPNQNISDINWDAINNIITEIMIKNENCIGLSMKKIKLPDKIN